MNVAFTLIGGKNWMGGYNYLLNLFDVLKKYTQGRVTPYLFVGNDVDQELLQPFESIDACIVVSSHFNQSRNVRRLAFSICLLEDRLSAKIFKEHNIDLVFENAQFFGSCFSLPVMGWIPDFQHRRLKSLFSFSSFWKRELGFQTQVLSGRTILLSSLDAKKDCDTYFPRVKERTVVVPFAVNIDRNMPHMSKQELIQKYKLPENFFFLPNQFYKHKNHMVVIKGVRLLSMKGKKVHVVLSGQPAETHHPGWFDTLMESIEQSGLSECFTYVGRIPFFDLIGFMVASQALINPSLFEGWSTTVEEAKSLGVPLLLSDIPVHREQTGQGAVFFDPSSPESFAQAVDRFEKGDHPVCQGHAFKDVDSRLNSFARGFEAAANTAIDSFHKRHPKR